MRLTREGGIGRPGGNGELAARWLRLVGSQQVRCAFCGGPARVVGLPGRAAICAGCVQRAALLLARPGGGDAA